MKIIAIYNSKGGVGKTTTAVNLAYLASAEGTKTLLWDLDPQAAATYYYRVRPKLKGGVKKLVGGKKSPLDYSKRTEYKNLSLLPADFSSRKLDIILHDMNKAKKRIGKFFDSLAKEHDLLFMDLGGKEQTGPYRCSIQQHCTHTTYAVFTTNMRSSQT